jgi:DNA-binding PadR family transcriptional regulator
MTHMHHDHGGIGRHTAPPHEPRGGHHRRGRRPFDYGALRLVVLAMIAETPSHGYELMKGIEERMGGGYSPSPGVIYPTLAWLEDMGFAVSEAEGGRKRYRITDEGAAFLAANKAALDALEARMGPGGRGRDVPDPVIAAMRGLKRALRARFAGGPVDAAAVEGMAAAIDEAAAQVAKGMANDEGGTGTLTSTARVVSPKAAGYAAQLCKHFAHKIPARFEGSDGEIAFPMGTCRLHVEGEVLVLAVEGADAGAVARLEEVVASHLLRFAFREELAIDWQRG